VIFEEKPVATLSVRIIIHALSLVVIVAYNVLL